MNYNKDNGLLNMIRRTDIITHLVLAITFALFLQGCGNNGKAKNKATHDAVSIKKKPLRKEKPSWSRKARLSLWRALACRKATRWTK